MPEWPDLHVVRGRLEKALVGHEIVLVRVGDPLVFRATRAVETALAHRRFTGVRHRGKFLIFDLDEGDGTSSVHGFEELGPEAGEFSWSEREFAERARATRREVRNLLQDQTFLAGIGNAYADEILWEARLHPKRRVATLSEDEMSRFYQALKDVIARGVLQVEEHLPPELGTKIRDHMKVRGHKGKPCPRCATPIVKTRHGLDDMYLCPRCQTPPKGQIR